MKLAKLPKVGDIIKFKSGYTFTIGPDQPPQQSYHSGYGGTTVTITGTSTQTFIEIEKGTLAEVIDRGFNGPHDSMSDNLSMSLVLSIMVNGEPIFFKFNYNLHKALVEVLKPSKALKVLYETK